MNNSKNIKFGFVCFDYEYHSVCFLIPKAKGSGFVKSPFGGHYANDKYKKMTDHENVSELVDIDGYCAVTLRESYEDKYLTSEKRELWEKVKPTINELFPRIENWVELNREDFYKLIM